MTKHAYDGETFEVLMLPGDWDLVIWKDGHYQLWRDDQLQIEGTSIAESLFAYGSVGDDFRSDVIPSH